VSWLDALIGRRRAILLSYSLTVAGIGMLWLVRPYPSVWLLYVFLLCFGGTIGSRGPLVTAAAMSIFRGKNIGTIFGTISIGSGLGRCARILGRRSHSRLERRLRFGDRVYAGKRARGNDRVSARPDTPQLSGQQAS
jgi:hypothetical protein